MRLLHRLKETFARVLWRTLFLAGVPGLFRWLNRRRVLIVMYHGVVPDDRGYYNWGQLPESKFRGQLEYLKRHYRIAPLDEVAAALRTGELLPPNTAAVTFDDGFANTATVASPHLRELGIPATVFLVTDYVGGDRLLWPDELFVLMRQAAPQTLDLSEFGLGAFRLGEPGCRWKTYVELLGGLKSIPAQRKDAVLEALRNRIGPVDPTGLADDFRAMSWDQVRELHEGGLIRFGGHTLTHEILTRIPPDDATHQMVESCRVVRRMTSQPEVAFAFPNGSRHDFNEFLQKVLRADAAACAVTTIEGLNATGDCVYSLKRIAVGADTSFGRFALKCSGFIPMVRSWAKAWRRALRPTAPRPVARTNWTDLPESPSGTVDLERSEPGRVH